MIAIAPGSVPLAQAQTRITVPGAGPLYFPKAITSLPLGRFYLFDTREEDGAPLSILEGYDVLNHMIGENWFSPGTVRVVNYPASIGVLSGSLSAPTVDDGVEAGRRSLDYQIKQAAKGGNPVAIAGLSEGTLVINRELAHLATDPDAPPAGSLSFVLFSSPELGLAHIYWPTGVTVPLIDYTSQDIAESQYDVSVVFHQYEFWADPPDRPWNLAADVNTLFGMAYYHNNAAAVVPSDAVEVSSVTSPVKGGTTTTYMIPSPTLPMLRPLQDLGVPSQIVDGLNSRLKPIVDAGYSRSTPDAGPHFSNGQLVGLSTRFPKSVRSGVDSFRNSDSRRVTEPPARMTKSPVRTDQDARPGDSPRRALKHVVHVVKKRLTNLADAIANRQDIRPQTTPKDHE